MSALTAKCPHCGSDEITGYDHVLATPGITGWTRNSDGELEPTWGGGSEVDWDSQTPVDPAKPYACGDCAMTLAATGLIVQED